MQNVRGAHFEKQPFESFPPFLSSPPLNKNNKSWIYPLPSKSGLNNPLFFCSGFLRWPKKCHAGHHPGCDSTRRKTILGWVRFSGLFFLRAAGLILKSKLVGSVTLVKRKEGVYTPSTKMNGWKFPPKWRFVWFWVLKMSFRSSKGVMFRVPVVSLKGSNLFGYPVYCIHVWNFPRISEWYEDLFRLKLKTFPKS